MLQPEIDPQSQSQQQEKNKTKKQRPAQIIPPPQSSIHPLNLPKPPSPKHYLLFLQGCPRGVMVKAMNCGIVIREFVLQSRYYVHFRANTLGKGMNPLILPPAMGK